MHEVAAQEQRFNAGVIMGLNFAELVGEGGTDYIGPNAGLMGTYRFARHGQVAMEILYSQNGEYILPEYYPALDYGRIRLHHLEIPVHVDLLVGLLHHDADYDWHLSIGMAYTELMSYRAEELGGINVSERVVYGNKRAMLLQAGTTYHLSRRVGLNWRVSLPIRVEGLSWTMAARALYLIG